MVHVTDGKKDNIVDENNVLRISEDLDKWYGAASLCLHHDVFSSHALESQSYKESRHHSVVVIKTSLTLTQFRKQ